MFNTRSVSSTFQSAQPQTLLRLLGGQTLPGRRWRSGWRSAAGRGRPRGRRLLGAGYNVRLHRELPWGFQGSGRVRVRLSVRELDLVEDVCSPLPLHPLCGRRSPFRRTLSHGAGDVRGLDAFMWTDRRPRSLCGFRALYGARSICYCTFLLFLWPLGRLRVRSRHCELRRNFLSIIFLWLWLCSYINTELVQQLSHLTVTSLLALLDDAIDDLRGTKKTCLKMHALTSLHEPRLYTADNQDPAQPE